MVFYIQKAKGSLCIYMAIVVSSFGRDQIHMCLVCKNMVQNKQLWTGIKVWSSSMAVYVAG